MLKGLKNDKGTVIMGRDWNSTLDFTTDRNGEEPHPQSVEVLRQIVLEHNLIDTWRNKYTNNKQYTGVKANNWRNSAARLDVTQTVKNRILNVIILPCGFSDHQLVFMDYLLSSVSKPLYYWCFNNNMLFDAFLCEKFSILWEFWKSVETDFINLIQWWEIGNMHIRTFCQQYTAFNHKVLKQAM